MFSFKKLSLAVCVAVASSGVLAKPILVKSQHDIEEYKLDNGLRVILAPNAKEDKVYLNTVYFTGSLDDPQGKGGLAHLLEHLMFKGTENVPDEEFQRRLDQYTLMTNAMTSFHYTQYISVMRAEQKNVNEMLHLEAERMDKNVIKMAHVPNEIEIVKREREIRLDQPFAVVQDQIFRELYGNQSLGRAPIGDVAEIQSITLNDLQKFYKTWYKPNNAAIVMTGNFNKAETLKKIEQEFESIPAASSFPDRAIDHIPAFDLSKLKTRQFNVKKGSHYMTLTGYMGGKDLDIQNELSLSGSLFTIQPSGRLYQQLVKTKQATEVAGVGLLENQYNFILFGAVFTPQLHKSEQIDKTLIEQVEHGADLTDEEVNRVKKATLNSLSKIENNAVEFGELLVAYVIDSPQGWTKYFNDLDSFSKIDAKKVNQIYKQFFTADKRLMIDIEPTPEDQKQAEQQKLATSHTLKSTTIEKPEPLKDVGVYVKEQQDFLKESEQSIQQIESKIQKGQFKNGLKYTFYPTTLKDDKVYATLSVGLGSVQSLWGKQVPLAEMTYLLTRGSKQYNLQQVQDKGIEVNGDVSSSIKGNRITIKISADKAHFADYFQFVMDMLQNPAFDVEDYEVNKASSLASLEQPYTEPDSVATLTLDQMTDFYDINDLRHDLLPEQAKQQIQASDLNQVKQLYRDFFAMNHANIAITGEFDVPQTKKILSQTLAKWNTKQPYQRALNQYYAHKGQKVHALAEKREFGVYQAYLTIPLGTKNADTPAMLVLSQILGGSQLSSRLAYELREHNNLTYGFSHDMSFSHFQDQGSWTLSANYQPGLADQVSQAVHKTIIDLKEKGITEQELEAAKAELLKYRVSSLADDRNVHSILALQLNIDEDFQNSLQRSQAIQQVTTQDVQRVLNKYIDLNQLIEVMADQYGNKIEFKSQD